MLEPRTLASVPDRDGDSVMLATMTPTSRKRAYTMRVDVEFLHEGHAAQHRLHAALPKQHAS